MKITIRITSIVILSLIFIIAISFALGQETKNVKAPIIKANDIKPVNNLTINNDLQKQGIEIVSFSDESFSDMLLQYIGDNKDLISFVESAKPFSFFMKNNSSKEVVGISLRWELVKSNGEIQKIPQIEANPGVLMGVKPIDPQMIGKTSLINSKDVKFLTYFSDIVGQKIAFANMRLNNPSINYKYQVDSENMQRDMYYLDSQKEKILNAITSISVSIDGIFFDDGTFVGKDENFFFDTLNGDLQARKFFLTALIEAKSSGKNDSELLDDILSNTSDISVNYAELHSSDFNSEQAFIIGYKTYLKNLRRELVMKRSKMSDERIINQLRSVQVSDFKTLRKVND